MSGMDPITIGAIAGGGTAVGSGLSYWLLKLLIKRFIFENDKKHELNAQSNAKVADMLTDVKMQLTALQTSMGQVIALKEQIQKDHDKLIEVATWNGKYQEDLVNQWNRVRDLTKKVEKCEETVEKNGEEIGEFISQMRAQGGAK